jgi:hypothetical protein
MEVTWLDDDRARAATRRCAEANAELEAARIARNAANARFKDAQKGWKDAFRDWRAALVPEKTNQMPLPLTEPTAEAPWPIGTEVIVRRDNGEETRTRTRSGVDLVGGEKVIWLEGIAGCYSLDRVRLAVASPAQTAEAHADLANGKVH